MKYDGVMTARDRWTVLLLCPQCGVSGTARVSQEDGWSFINGDQSTRIDFVPPGFKNVSTAEASYNFYCENCNCSAEK